MSPSGSLDEIKPQMPQAAYDFLLYLAERRAKIEAKAAQCAELLDLQYEASRRMIDKQGFYYPDELPHRERIAELTAEIQTLEMIVAE